MKPLTAALLIAIPLTGLAQSDPTGPFTLRSWSGAKQSNQTSWNQPYNAEAGQQLELSWAVSNLNKPYIFMAGWSDNGVPPINFGTGLPARGTARWTPSESYLPNPWTARRLEIMLFARINKKDFWQRAYVRVVPTLPVLSLPNNPERSVNGVWGTVLTAQVNVPFSFTPPLPRNAWRPEQMPFLMEYPWNLPPNKRLTEWEKTPWLKPHDMGPLTVSIPSRTGRVSGTPTKPGLFKYSMVIRNDGHQLVKTFFIDVKPKTPSLPSGQARAADLLNHPR